MQPHPRPENPEKGGNPHAGEYGPGFLPLSPFSGTGAAQNAISNGAAAALAAVRAYRRIPPPKPPHASRRILQAARAGLGTPGQAPVATPGVPLDWCEGFALLASRSAPGGPSRHRSCAQARAANMILRSFLIGVPYLGNADQTSCQFLAGGTVVGGR